MKRKYEIMLIGIIVILGGLSIISFVFTSKNKYFSKETRLSKVLKYQKKDKNNYKTVGWIRVQGTNIDYPVLKFKENLAPVEEERYAWTTNEDGKFHNNIMVLGHNVFNLSSKPNLHLDIYRRFEELMGFVYEDFARDNQFIQLTIDGEEYIYQIFSVGFFNNYLYSTFPDLGDVKKDDLDKHIDLLKNESFYDYDINVNGKDDILSVVTCTRFFNNSGGINFIVSAKRVEDSFFIKPNLVTVNKNYDVVEEAMVQYEAEEKNYA